MSGAGDGRRVVFAAVALGSLAAAAFAALVFARWWTEPDLPAEIPAPVVRPAFASGFTELDGERARVPIDTSRGRAVVHVWIDGEGPFLFGIDTGASYDACVDHRLVERLGLERAGDVENGDGTGQRMRRDLVRIETLDIGGVRWNGVVALADEYGWLNPPWRTPELGLLGYPLFCELLLRLDWADSTLELSRETLAAGDPDTVDYVERDGLVWVPVESGSYRAEVLVDSGSGAALSVSSRALPALRLAGEPRFAGHVRTAYSKIPIREGRLRDPLRVGGRVLTEVPVRILDAPWDGVIGTGVLRHFVLELDARHRRMRLTLPSS